MKKTIGIMSIMFAFAVAFSCTLVKAYSSPDNLWACVEGVKYGSFDVKTGYYTKNRGPNQSVGLNYAKTSVTNPCPNCRIGFKLFLEDGSSITGVEMVMGEMKNFYSTSGWYTNYKLGILRADFTLLNTSVDYTWNINI